MSGFQIQILISLAAIATAIYAWNGYRRIINQLTEDNDKLRDYLTRLVKGIDDHKAVLSAAHSEIALRDIAAALALHTYTMSNPDIDDSTLARLAYDSADALISERRRRG